MGGCGLDLFGSGQDLLLVGIHEHNNELLDFIKFWVFLGLLIKYYLL
jgi:hypothetical protein